MKISKTVKIYSRQKKKHNVRNETKGHNYKKSET